jgi:hypothetical protein
MRHGTFQRSLSGRKYSVSECRKYVLTSLALRNSTIEVNVAIMCSCLFLLPAFLNHFFPSFGERVTHLLSRFTRSTDKYPANGACPSRGKGRSWPGPKRLQKLRDETDENVQFPKTGGIWVASEVALVQYPRNVKGTPTDESEDWMLEYGRLERPKS